MAVYTELLRLAVAKEEEPASVEALVSEALARRANLGRGNNGPDRLAAELAYDASLVRLCRAKGLETALLDGDTPGARKSTEDALASVLKPASEPPSDQIRTSRFRWPLR